MSRLPKLVTYFNKRTSPVFGLGTWKSEPNEVYDAILTAIKSGYRHIDCAATYENEEEVGRAFMEAFKIVPRSEIFITSKLWNTMHHPDDVPKACEKTLKDLQLDYLDLYLIHWPLAFKNDGTGNTLKDANGRIVYEDVTLEQTWRAMEKLVDSGKVRTIGVSNYNITKLRDLLSYARIRPAVNQVEMHPYLPQNELLEFCKANDIVVTAYSPIGGTFKPTVREDPVVTEIAKKHGKTNAQVLISWAIQRGTQVIPKSVNPKRIVENMHLFELPSEDFEALNNLHKTTQIRYLEPMKFWKVDVFGEAKI